jgi:hypothetical protein
VGDAVVAITSVSTSNYGVVAAAVTTANVGVVPCQAAATAKAVAAPRRAVVTVTESTTDSFLEKT